MAARFGGPTCLASHLPACFVLSLRPTRRPPEAPGSRPHPPLRKSRLRRGRNQPTPRESLTDPVVYDLLDWIRGSCSIKEGPVQFFPFPSVPFRFFYWMAWNAGLITSSSRNQITRNGQFPFVYHGMRNRTIKRALLAPVKARRRRNLECRQDAHPGGQASPSDSW